jgi:signal transduction histidine kinase
MGALSELIRGNTSRITELWFVDARLADAARGLTRVEMARGLTAQLEALARLADGDGDARGLLEPLVEAQVEDRLRQGYELADIIHEYALLERCIYQLWASTVSHLHWPSPIEMARVHGALGEVLHAAVALYTSYLLEEEQIEKRHVAMLYRIAGASEDAPLEHRLRALSDEVRLAIGAGALIAFAWDAETKELHHDVAVGFSADLEASLRTLPPGAAPVQDSVLQAERAVELAPAELHPSVQAALAHSLGVGDAAASVILAHPIRTGDRLLGIMVAALPDRTRLPARARRFSALVERLAPLWENARLYERTQADLARLREERQLREWFVSTLAHDLRGPLAAAQVNAELILRKALDAQLRRLTAKVVRGLHATDELIRDLLDVHRVRAGQKLPLRLADCDLGEVVAEVLEELSATHAGKIELEMESAVRGVFCATELRRAVWNLASNALKYGDPTRPVTIRVRKQPTGVALAVHNWGPPIAAAELPVIFEPYQRARGGEARSVGWGLGLALVKACAEAHGGTVGVDSADDRGTTFTLNLPLRAAERAVEAAT